MNFKSAILGIFWRILTRCSGLGRLINLVDQRQRIIASLCFLVIAFLMRFHYNTGFPLHRRKLRRDLRQGEGRVLKDESFTSDQRDAGHISDSVSFLR